MANCSLRLRLWGTLYLPYGGMGKGEMSVLWLWQLGELDMRSREWKKWYCIQPIAALGRADLAPKLGSTIKLILLMRFQGKGTRDQEVLPPHSTSAMWWHGRGKKCLPSLCSLPPTAAVRAGPETRMGKLALPLTSCSSWKSRHTRATCLTGVQVS